MIVVMDDSSHSIETPSSSLNQSDEASDSSLNQSDASPASSESPASSASPNTSDVPPCIFVVHASVGSGHRSAAEAVGEELERLRDTGDTRLTDGLCVPPDCIIEVLDILDFARTHIDGDKTVSMFTGATRPIYDLTWRYTLTGRLLWGGGTIWSHIMFPAFTELVEKKQPMAIICTHITAANVAVGSRMLTGLRYPIICVPTDYETEGLWPHKTSDLFCVATESMAETLRPRKVPDSKIRITGIPSRTAFSKPYDKSDVRASMGLPRDATVVLILAGAHLPHPYVNFRKTIDEVLPYLGRFRSMHFVIVAGQDNSYATHMRNQCADLAFDNITVYDYVEEMAALMATSDLVICKSGGLTVTECLCAQVPMLLLGRAYGQESINTRMLTSTGAAMHVTTKRELVESLKYISENPRSTKAMLVNGSYLRRPDAAFAVSQAALLLARECDAGKLSFPRKRFLWFYWGKKPAHIR